MRSLKNGRFVDTADGAGVVFDASNYPSIIVHLLDDNGETVSKKEYQSEDVTVTDEPLPARIAVVHNES